MKKAQADIFLLGSGIKSFYQLTLEARYVLGECSELYYYHDLPSFEKYIKDIHRHPVSLLKKFYLDGRERGDIYQDTVDFLIERARKNPGIAFITHGHPLVGSTLSQMLMSTAREEGLQVEVCSGVSCFDTIMTDLKLDPVENGLLFLEASLLLAKPFLIQSALDTVLMQIAQIGSSLAKRTEEHSSSQLSELKSLLLKHYPPNHPLSIVESSVEVGFESVVFGLTLGELDSTDFPLLYNHSLFIPALIKELNRS